jgi:glycosyl transferase, family 25
MRDEHTVAGGDGLPPIWVINLRRSLERRAHITRHLRQLGLAFELVEAVDGSELGAEAMRASYDPSRAMRALSRELTPGEVGCALSHLHAYRRMADEGIPSVLIIEDDVVIEPACIDLLRRLDRFPEDWELMLFFHNGGPASYWGRRRLDDGHHSVRFTSHVWGTGGYLLKRSAALKLLRGGYPVHVPSDGLTGGLIPNDIAMYGMSPPGYTTEKIYEPMAVHSIPIYWGNPLVGRDFNSRSFVNCHEYAGAAAIERIIAIDRSEAEYQSVLGEPYFHGNTVNEFVQADNVIRQFHRIFSEPRSTSWRRSLSAAGWRACRALVPKPVHRASVAARNRFREAAARYSLRR